MGKPWSEEHRRKFLATMKKRYPEGTRSRARRLQARDPHKFDMVQHKPHASNGEFGSTVEALRSQRDGHADKIMRIEAAIVALEALA